MVKKIVVVGGVAGGATAIARLRRLNEDAEIILIEKGEYVSFANCGLPYYIGGVIPYRDNLFVSDIASIIAKYNINIRNFSEVTEVRPKEKKILIKNVKTGEEYEESYDKLILSTGSKPFVPEISGVDNENVFTLWDISDTDKIFNYIKNNKPSKAVIAGGGFIGLEMAENIKERGIDVTLVEFADQVMQPLDKDMAKIVENHLQEKGIHLLLSTGLTAIEDNGKKLKLSDGSIIDADMTLLSIGVRPNTGYLKLSGLDMNNRGGLVTDERLRTSDPDIYAVGDMIEVLHRVSKEKVMIPLAAPANKQGRAVAANVLGLKEETYKGGIGTSIAKIFDLSVAATGENEKTLIRRGLKLWKDYGVSIIHPSSHAGYYAGAMPLSIKLLFEYGTGKVLGAQIVGYAGVDKRIDTIATSIYFGGTVYDLTGLELAYAPPYSSAKDPVNMAGYVATNILEGLTEPITFDEWVGVRDKVITIDVRERMEVMMGEIENSVNLPLTYLRDNLDKLDKDKDYVVTCAIGVRGYIAERIMKQRGFKVRNLTGGYATYSYRMQ